jgi:hypothetical protein
MQCPNNGSRLPARPTASKREEGVVDQIAAERGMGAETAWGFASVFEAERLQTEATARPIVDEMKKRLPTPAREIATLAKVLGMLRSEHACERYAAARRAGQRDAAGNGHELERSITDEVMVARAKFGVLFEG